MLRVSVSIVLLLLVGLVAAVGTNAGEPVLILGDSLSAGYGIKQEEGWPALLASRLQEEGYRHSVINASISGETTAGGARRIKALLAAKPPAVLVIALGANDGLRAVNVAETRRNLLAMIDRASEAGIQTVLVKVRIPPNYGPLYTTAFEDMYDDVAASTNVLYAPFMLERFAIDRGAFQGDGLHPTAAVQPQILATLWPAIKQALDLSKTEAVVD